jgi:putative ABC transport system permease protein
MFNDIRLAARQLLSSRAHTLVCLLTLALCIGANTAMFSIVRAVLLRPLPFAQADRIVTVQETNLEKGIESSNVSTASYMAWRQQAHSFSALSAADYSPFTISGKDKLAERVGGWQVTANVFQVYGIQALLGQLFTKENEEPSRDNVVAIRESLWKRVFNSDPQIVGRSMMVNAQPHTIVGVLPDRFNLPGPERFEMWKPLVLNPAARDAATDFHLVVRGLLAPNATFDSAGSEMSVLARRLAATRPAEEQGWNARVIPLFQDLVGDYRGGLLTLCGAIAAVLLIGCVNLANLILSRAVSRQRELAIRVALGASRVRIVRQLLMESLILSLAGGALGLLLAAYAMPVLVSVLPASLPRLDEAKIDWAALSFTGGIALLAGTLVALLPAWFSTRLDPVVGLKQGASRTQSDDVATGRWRRILLVAEIALSFALLIAAALLLQSFVNLRNVDPGFRAENVLNNVVVLPTARYGQGDEAHRFARGVTAANPKAAQFFDRLFAQLKTVPGVVAAGSITGLPLYGNSQFTTYRRLSHAVAGELERPVVQDTIGGDYFQTVGIPLRQGRVFTQFDIGTSQRVAIVNQALALRDFKKANPIGENISIEGGAPCLIVGVVGDTRQFTLGKPATPEVYTPVAQTATTYAYVLVRANKLNDAFTQSVLKVFAALDPELPLPQRTLQSALDQALGTPRFEADLLGGFAIVALLLALIGVYGVLNYDVAQRRPEIAIRLALGATPANVVRLILARGIRIVMAGLIAGAILAVCVSLVLRHQLFGLSWIAPRVYLEVALMMIATATLACLLPAHRASTVDPLSMLRAE